jgi:epoxyqueuosine reductase
LDARRCISYLTIENRGPIPIELRPAIGDWLFGCDICQQVCPWNERFARSPASPELSPTPPLSPPDPAGFLAGRISLKSSATARTRRQGMARNTAIVLGNRRSSADFEALHQALLTRRTDRTIPAAWAWAKSGRGGGRQPAPGGGRSRMSSQAEIALRSTVSARTRGG